MPLKSEEHPIVTGEYALGDIDNCQAECKSILDAALTSNATKKARELLLKGIPLTIPEEEEVALLDLFEWILFQCQLEILFVSMLHFTKFIY